MDKMDGFGTTEITVAQYNAIYTLIGGVTAGTITASKAVFADASGNIGAHGVNGAITFVTGAQNPINMDSITTYDTIATGSLGNVIKINLTGTAVHTATTAGALIKNYAVGCTINGNYELSAIIGYLKHSATLSGGAKASLMSLHRHGSSTGTVDYGIRIFTAANKITTMLYGSGNITNFLEAVADGDAGCTLGTGMCKDPENDSEAGYITIIVAGTTYQIPFYAST